MACDTPVVTPQVRKIVQCCSNAPGSQQVLGPLSSENLERNVWVGLKRGLSGLCPACGRSKLFSAYLKVVPACAGCQHPLVNYKADDGPAYFTILIIGHLLIAPMLFLEAVRTWPEEVLAGIAVPSIVVLALLLLPRVKGAFVGVQWAVGDRSEI